MPRVVFEPTIPAFERTKTVHALVRAATVIGITSQHPVIKTKCRLRDATRDIPLLTCSTINSFLFEARIKGFLFEYFDDSFIENPRML
jgi:hypothetical protein